MADPQRKRRVEHTHETQHLAYGQFATATYDHEATHSWRFLRQDGGTPGHSLLRDEALSSTPASKFRLLHSRVVKVSDRPQSDSKPSPGRKNPRRPDRLHRQHPDLALASPVSFDDDDDAATAVPQQKIAPRGQLLSCGRVSGIGARGQRLASAGVPVIASANGTAEEHLWITPIEIDQVSVDGGSGIETDISVSLTSKIGIQHRLASTEPILQICFSGHHTMVGVRKASSITLLPSLWTGRPQEPVTSSLSSSSIRIDDTLILPISRTGGYLHAHLAFNPRHEQELAVIDVHGVWSVWRFNGKGSLSTRVLFQAHLRSSGRLLRYGSLNAERSNYDGWHRICWLDSRKEADDALLVVCSRQVAAVFSVSGEMLGEVDMRIGVKTAKNFILDVQTCTAYPDMCFVLTSTRILVMRVADGVLKTEVHQEPLSLMCSWDHFRGQQDLTLRMSVLELTDNAQHSLRTERLQVTTTLVHFVFSLRNKEVTMRTLAITSEALGDARTISVGDPCSFPLPEVVLKHHSPVSDIDFRVASSNEHTSGNRHSGHEAGVTLLVRVEDGTVFEAVYDYAKTHGVEKLGPKVQPCISTKPTRQGRQVASFKYVDDDDDDDMGDFVVEDSNQVVPHGSSRQDHDGDERQSVSNVWSRPRAWVDVLASEAVEDPVTGINDVSEALSSALSDESKDIGMTLVEKIPAAGLDDAEEASEAMASWINDASTSGLHADQARLRAVPIFASSPRPLLEQYNYLIEGYVDPLSTDVPDRMRVNTERLSRTAAFETFLASYALQRRRREEFQTPEDGPATEATEQRQIDGNPLSRLSRYTTINKNASHVFNTKAMTEVLGHLPTDINADPSDYSYKDTELELAMARNCLDTDLDPEAKRHAEKLARYEKKRLERERRKTEEMALQKAMMANQVMSSQLPQAGSSQAGSSPAMNATQPERGAFGARQKMPKAGKKRVAGF